MTKRVCFEIDSWLSSIDKGCSVKRYKLGSEMGVRSPFTTRLAVVNSLSRLRERAGVRAIAHPALPPRSPRNWGQSPISYVLGESPDSPRPESGSDPKCLSRLTGCYSRFNSVYPRICRGYRPKRYKLGSEIGVRSPFRTRFIPVRGEPVRNGALTPIFEPNRSSATVVGSFPRWGKGGMGACAHRRTCAAMPLTPSPLVNLPLRSPRNWGQSPISYLLGESPDRPRPESGSDPKYLSRLFRPSPDRSHFHSCPSNIHLG